MLSIVCIRTRRAADAVYTFVSIRAELGTVAIELWDTLTAEAGKSWWAIACLVAT